MEKFEIKEPVKNTKLTIALLPIDKIVIPFIQRDRSKKLSQKIKNSIEKVGFIDPILVVPSEQEGLYEVIDGQHRFVALQELWYQEIPAIIVDKKYKDYILLFNIEKTSNLKDKAHQVYNLYQYYKQQKEFTEEDLVDIFEMPYYITIGYILEYFKLDKFPGYAWENILKRIDQFLPEKLEKAEEERIKRAKKLIEVNEVLENKFKNENLKNALQKETIVRKAWQEVYWPRVRIIEDDYYTALEKIKQAIPNIVISEEEV